MEPLLIRKKALAFGLYVVFFSLFLILSFDLDITITDDNTSIPGSAYGFSLRSREDRPVMSVEELSRMLKATRHFLK